MKRLLVLIVISMISVSVSTNAQMSHSDSLLFQAGSALKVRYENRLKKISLEADNAFSDMVRDSVVTKDEMGRLQDVVDRFSSAKRVSDENLVVYNLSTSTKIDSLYRKITGIYFDLDNFFRYEDNESENIRELIVGRIGYDVRVEPGKACNGSKWGLDIIVAAIVGCVWWLKKERDGESKEKQWVNAFFAFLISLLIISVIFFLL